MKWMPKNNSWNYGREFRIQFWIGHPIVSGPIPPNLGTSNWLRRSRPPPSSPPLWPNSACLLRCGQRPPAQRQPHAESSSKTASVRGGHLRPFETSRRALGKMLTGRWLGLRRSRSPIAERTKNPEDESFRPNLNIVCRPWTLAVTLGTPLVGGFDWRIVIARAYPGQRTASQR